MIFKTTQSLRCSLTMRSFPQESLQVCNCKISSSRLSKSRFERGKSNNKFFALVCDVNVCKSHRRPARETRRAHERGELGIQRDDVASRERVHWEPIRLERPIIPMTR
ncbi:hypothetical protein D1007_42664 [Hordeum vulgare]|nr:hypothetical protein D1007_42664 [Hordeum vulgare]